MSLKPSNKIFISNIPFEQTEEQLTEIFSEVGPVENFRLVFDKETGRPKGCAYCTYKDIETAASAKRNLNGYSVNNRNLRVEFAEDVEMLGNVQQSVRDSNTQSVSDRSGALGSPAVDQVRSVISKLTPDSMLRILQTIKELQSKNPAQAKVVLEKSPALMYGMLHILVQLGLITPEMIAASVHSQSGLSSGTPATAQTNPQLAALASQIPLLANCLTLPPAQAAQTIQSLISLNAQQILQMPPEHQSQVYQLQQLVRQGQFRI